MSIGKAALLGRNLANAAVFILDEDGFLIWLGYNYLTPVTSVAGGLYAIWQNLFNSWELYQHEHGK